MAKILHIDDQDYFRKDLCFILEEEGGFDTLDACNDREALRLIQEEKPDLILCDVNMPGTTGFELIKQVRAISEDCANIPFIFLTGLTDKSDIIKGTSLCPDDYLTKPVELAVLIAKINAAIERTKQQLAYKKDVLFTSEKLNGTAALENEKINLRHLLEEVTARIKQTEHNKLRPIFVDIESQLPDINADYQCLSKTLHTLLMQLTSTLPSQKKLMVLARLDLEEEEESICISVISPCQNKRQVKKIINAAFVQDMVKLQGMSIQCSTVEDRGKITLTIPAACIIEIK